MMISAELHVLREILMHKYGREFSIAVMENRDGRVSDRVSRCWSCTHPDPILHPIAPDHSHRMPLTLPEGDQ